MLVISMKKGEKVHIGKDITVTVVDLKSGKARLGIEAPDNCRIMRDSLLRQEQEAEYLDDYDQDYNS